MAPNPETNLVNKCVVCKEAIEFGAKRCIHCGSSQGWTRHFGVGSTVLALLVALISVLQSAGPTLVGLFAGKYSKIEMTLLSLDERSVNFIASNTGNMPGAIGAAEVELYSKTSGDYRFSSSLASKQTGVLLGPGDTIEVSYFLPDQFDKEIQDFSEDFGATSLKNAKMHPKDPIFEFDFPPIEAILKVYSIQYGGFVETENLKMYIRCGFEGCGVASDLPRG